MKKFNTPISLAMSLLMCTSMIAQTAERTLVKSFNLKENKTVVLDLKGQVEVQHWKNDLVRIQIGINLENASDAVLKSLIAAGRYNLTDVADKNGLVISSPTLDKEITIKGQLLKEHLTYTIFLPEDVSVKIADESSTTVENVKENSSAL
jgi:hypothetical protein